MDQKPLTFWERWIAPKPGTRQWSTAWLVGFVFFLTLIGGVVALVYFFPEIVK